MTTKKDELRCFFSERNLRKIDHPVVCFDSDDWGVTRCSDINQKMKLISMGFDMDSEPFVANDRIETAESVGELATILSSFTDSYGSHPIFTLNFSMFNPDYEKIIASGFGEYFSIPFFQSYTDGKHTIESFLANKNKCFSFSFHGAEHLNVLRFLSDGRKKIGFASEAASFGLTCFGNSYSKDNRYGYMDELNVCSNGGTEFLIERFKRGLDLFYETFSFRPSGFASCCGVISKDFIKRLRSIGLIYEKTSFCFDFPSQNGLVTRHHFSLNNYGVSEIIRPFSFEPLFKENQVQEALSGLDLLVKFHKPCIFSTHRINYSSLYEDKTEHSLIQLNELLSSILRKYPNVEFLSTDECLHKYGKPFANF